MSIEDRPDWADVTTWADSHSAQPDGEVECSSCGTDLTPGLDTIVTFPQAPGTPFCDRCEVFFRLGLEATTHAPEPREHLVAHRLILAALIMFAAGVVAIALTHPY